MQIKSLEAEMGKIVLLASVLMFSACTTKISQPMTEYSLTVPAVQAGHSSRYKYATLKVAYPESLKAKMTRDIAYSYSLSDRGVYQNSQWTNEAGKLIQGTVIEALEGSGNFKGVVSYGSTALEDLRLESSIYDFSHHIRGDASYAVVAIKFILIDTNTGKLVKNKKFYYKVYTSSVDARGYVEATNKAMTSLSRDLIQWLR